MSRGLKSILCLRPQLIVELNQLLSAMNRCVATIFDYIYLLLQCNDLLELFISDTLQVNDCVFAVMLAFYSSVQV